MEALRSISNKFKRHEQQRTESLKLDSPPVYQSIGAFHHERHQPQTTDQKKKNSWYLRKNLKDSHSKEEVLRGHSPHMNSTKGSIGHQLAQNTSIWPLAVRLIYELLNSQHMLVCSIILTCVLTCSAFILLNKIHLLLNTSLDILNKLVWISFFQTSVSQILKSLLIPRWLSWFFG